MTLPLDDNGPRVPFVSHRARRWLTASAFAWLLAVVAFATLHAGFERAPLINVRWAASIDDATRVVLEQRLFLSGAAFDSGQTWRYYLLSPTEENIRAIVQSPAVDDTNHIDRHLFRLTTAPHSGPYLARWPWIPLTLQVLTTIFLAVGTGALLIAAAPAAMRGVRVIFSPEIPGHNARPFLTTETLATVVMGAALAVVWWKYFRELRAGATSSLGFRVGDWLVGYMAGFSRRGLLGSPIVWATSAFHVQPEPIVLAIQAALYTLLSVLLFLLARRRRLTIWFLAFLFSPAGLLFPLYDIAVIGRKDVLFFAVFALYAWWMPRPGRWWVEAVTFALGAATTLIHELFFFFTPYFFLMRALDATRESGGHRFRPEWSLFAGSLLALLLVSTIGADMHGEEQCAALLRHGFQEDLCGGILRYPSTTLAAARQDVARAINERDYLVAYPIASVLAVLPLVPLVASGRRRPPPVFWRGVVAALAFTVPMFGIILDWGRLLNIHVMATAIIILKFVLEDRTTEESVFGMRMWWLRVAIVVGLSLYLTTWSIRHCCADPLRAGVFKSV